MRLLLLAGYVKWDESEDFSRVPRLLQLRLCLGERQGLCKSQPATSDDHVVLLLGVGGKVRLSDVLN